MDNRLKILHIEDLSCDARLVEGILKKANLDFEMLVVDTKDKFLKALNDYLPTIILSDHSLPSFNSHEALAILGETGLRIPFILITANISEEFAVDVIKRGADDYVLKDRLKRLPTAIANALEKFRLEKERQVMLEELIKNEKHYRALIENINDAIVLINEHAEFIYQSPSVKRLTGFAIDDLKNKKVFDYIHPDDLHDCAALFQQVYAEPGASISCQYRVLHKKGNYIWTEGSIINLLHDESVKAIIVNHRDITKKKQAENALRQSEFRYRQIVETAQEGIWLIDENNITTFVNKKMCEILGYSQEEMLGKESFYFMDEAGNREATISLERRKKGIKENIILPFITKAGKHIWTNVSANPIFDDDKNYKGALAMVADITEKRDLESLLDKTNNLARIGNWEINLADNSLYWSSLTKQIHEVDGDFIPDIQNAINYYKAGASRDSISRVIQEAKVNGSSWDLELQVITARNNERWVRAMGEVEMVNGKCIRMYGSLQDIDAGKTAEIEVLKAYKERNIILESISDAFFAVDKNWLVTYWNKEAEKILGRSKQEVLGKNLWEIYGDVIDTTPYVYLLKAVEENTVQHFETFYQPMNKSYEITAYPSPTGLSLYFKDITEKKMLQQCLLEEQMNTQKEITKAVVHAQEKERAEIGEELHDNVNQLLAASKLYLDHSLTHGGKKEFIIKAKGYIASSMEEIRKLSHALVGPTQDKLMGLIESLGELIGNISVVKVIKISFNHSAYHEEYAEPGLKLVIYRIIQEQLNNILKHSAATEVKIDLGKKGEDLTLIITDNGKGFDTSQKRNGIGLKNINNRASLYNGVVELISSPGNGCKMSIVFTPNRSSCLNRE